MRRRWLSNNRHMQTSNAQERKGGRHHCWDQRLQTGEEKEDHLHRHNYKNGDDGGVRRQSSVRFDIHIGFETETKSISRLHQLQERRER